LKAEVAGSNPGGGFLGRYRSAKLRSRAQSTFLRSFALRSSRVMEWALWPLARERVAARGIAVQGVVLRSSRVREWALWLLACERVAARGSAVQGFGFPVQRQTWRRQDAKILRPNACPEKVHRRRIMSARPCSATLFVRCKDSQAEYSYQKGSQKKDWWERPIALVQWCVRRFGLCSSARPQRRTPPRRSPPRRHCGDLHCEPGRRCRSLHTPSFKDYKTQLCISPCEAVHLCAKEST